MQMSQKIMPKNGKRGTTLQQNKTKHNSPIKAPNLRSIADPNVQAESLSDRAADDAESAFMQAAQDPNGSYTGYPTMGSQPVQDVDDLQK